jgi:hypothetical protein
MTEQERHQMDGAAALIGLQELLRIVIAEMCFDLDPGVFRERARKVEETAVNGITGRTHFPQAPAETEQFLKESASALVTKIMASIRHPADQ